MVYKYKNLNLDYIRFTYSNMFVFQKPIYKYKYTNTNYKKS